MAATPEKKAKKRVDALLDKALAAHGTYWFAPPANGYGRSGIPDRIGCCQGKFFSVEVKADTDVTELQFHEMHKITNAGGMAFVVRINAKECHGMEELAHFLGVPL